MLKGKTAEEAAELNAQELSGDLGALPPMKIHCGQMVEGALRDALAQETGTEPPAPSGQVAESAAPSLIEKFSAAPAGKKIKIVPLDGESS